jgi:sorting nexin-29
MLIASDGSEEINYKQPGMSEELRIGTWNVFTLCEGRALRNLEKVLQEYKVDIIALQEIRLIGQAIVKGRDSIIYYSGHKSKHEFGCGFIVSKKVKHLDIDFIPIDHRICTLRVKGRFNKLSWICAHAPTENNNEDIKDTFYKDLETTIIKCPKNDVKILLGDFNAKVGSEDPESAVVGKYGLHKESSDNELRLIGLANALNMVIGSTTFSHKNIHLNTWRSRDGKTANQIYHVLIDARHKSNMMDVRSYRGANTDTDHYLVITRIRAKINQSKYNLNKAECVINNVSGLQQPKIKKDYEDNIRKPCNETDEEEIDSGEWTKCEDITRKAADEKIGRLVRNDTNGWFDQECAEITEEKNRRFTEAAREEYSEAQTKEKRIHKKKEYYEEQLKLNAGKESRKFYKQDRSLSCRNMEEEILSNNIDMLKWEKYVQDLYGEGEDRVELQTQIFLDVSEGEDIPIPTLEEVKYLIQKLNNNRAPGPDGLNAGLFETEENNLMGKSWKMIKKVWMKEKIPKQWEEGLICPIYEKGDCLMCENYHACIAYKVFSNILFQRLQPYVEKLLGNYQCGFRNGKSMSDQLHSMRQILEKMREYGLSTFNLFVNFKATYDSINRTQLFKAMEEFQISRKLRSLVEITLINVRCKVKTPSGITDPFDQKKGLQHGDALSCMLFNIALEKAVREAKLDIRGTILHKSVQILAYVDDVVVVARDENEVKDAFNRLEMAAQKIGLMINYDKTKYMETTCKPNKEKYIRINNRDIERVNQFKYLGSIITNNNNISSEINRRIDMGNTCYYGLRNILRSRLLKEDTKCKIYKTLIRRVVLYGCESWTLTKEEEEKLNIFERKILRKIYGPIKYNDELYNIYKEPSIVKMIKIARLKWLRHIVRMEDNAPCKEITFSQPEGSRKKGRPKLRWLDSVLKDEEEEEEEEGLTSI